MKTVYFDKDIPRILVTKAAARACKPLLYTNLNAVKYKKDIPEPKLPAADWVRVKNIACGLCGTDVSFFKATTGTNSALEPIPGSKRTFLGHENVGVVTEVGYNWCTVLTILDTDTSLGAQVFRTGDVGVAQGDFALMNEGRLALTYLPADSDLLVGDLVVTPGLGGYYPSDLVIGTVEELRLDDSGSTEFAVIAPSADLKELVEVFIIKSFDIVS